MFLDRDTNQVREFVKMVTDGGATITATPAHLILVWAKQKTDYVFADTIQEGDFVLVNVNGTLRPQKVINVSATLGKGVFAPLTKEGTVVVDSVAASCYALIDSQLLAHLSFVPWRTYNTISHWFSWSANSRSTPSSLSLPRENGIHWYAKLLYSIKDYVIPSNMLYH